MMRTRHKSASRKWNAGLSAPEASRKPLGNWVKGSLPCRKPSFGFLLPQQNDSVHADPRSSGNVGRSPRGGNDMDIAAWLRGLGLERYEQAFSANEYRLGGADARSARLTSRGSGCHSARARSCSRRSPASRRKRAQIPAQARPPPPTTPRACCEAKHRQLTVSVPRLVDFDSPVGTSGRRRAERRHPRLRRLRERRGEPLRGPCRQIHGRWGACLLRLAQGARGRRRAGGPLRPRRR